MIGEKFKRFAILLFSVSLLVPFINRPAYAVDSGATNPNSKQTDQIIVKLKSPTTRNEIAGYHIADNPTEKNPSIVSVEVPDKENVARAVKKINSTKNVEYAEPDFKLKLNSIPNDPLYSKQWFHKVIKTDEAWEITKGSPNLIVAVIDDGINPNQPDLKSQIVSPYVLNNNTDQYKDMGVHGTHVSGIIAAASDNSIGGSGIAPNVKIMPINVFTGDKNGEFAYISDIIKGIQYAINHGAKIINMSLGDYEYSQALNDAIQEAYKKGLIIVAAAGNDDTSNRTYPAAYDHVISVASTNIKDQISSYSNFGDRIDISAPGENILSTLPNGFGYMSGTSMAAPVVSGVAALVWSNNPNLSNVQVMNNLLLSADDLGGYGKDPVFGWGRVNAAKALRIKSLPKPFINTLSDRDIIITGKGSGEIQTGQIIVSNGKGIIGKASLSGNPNFSVTIPKQKAGTKLSVQLIVSENSRSMPTTITVTDRTPPPVPSVNKIGDSTSVITGKAEPNSSITIWLGTKMIGKGITNSKGVFSVKIKPQKAGAVLSIICTDQSKNSCLPVKVVVKDKTAPKAPKVYPVSNLDSRIKGVAEANSTIIIKVGKKVIGVGKVKNNQQFNIKIPKQNGKTKLSIAAIDLAKNKSDSVIITVLDKNPPKKPIIFPITSKSTSVAGKTEAFAKVVVKSTKSELGEGRANSKGFFSVKVKRQKRNSSIYVNVYDQSGNRSVASVRVQ